MRWGVVVFPGSNDDRDVVHATQQVLGDDAVALWHKDRSLGGCDAVVLPGGFSYGDYLRCGAMASCSPIMDAVREHARSGGVVVGTCNGFQILCEVGLLPGALVANRSLKFICEIAFVRVESADTALTYGCRAGEVLSLPIKHGEGCYVADERTIAELEDRGQVVFRYADRSGRVAAETNPNGSIHNIAGIRNEAGNVVGLMPHPEHAVDDLTGPSTDGLGFFASLVKNLAGAPLASQGAPA